MPTEDFLPQRRWLLTWENVEGLMAIGPFRHAFPVGRHAILQYDGAYLSLEIELHQEELHENLNILPEALRFDVSTSPRRITAKCVDSTLRRHFYMYLCETLELIREEGRNPTDAFKVAWERFGDFIQQQAVLSQEKQIGLLGELAFLKILASIGELGWAHALDSWHQTAQSEHDFSLRKTDFEVKTTTKEKREHIIGSLDQLKENPGRSLSLVSFHLTHAPQNIANYLCLTELITQIAEELTSQPSLRDQFVSRLHATGWREAHSHFYLTRYVPRNIPTIIPVDERFPRLTRAALTHLPDEARLRITSVVYGVDVIDLGEPLTALAIQKVEHD